MSVWQAEYESNVIRITNRSSTAELHVNNELQDEKFGLGPVGDLTGHLFDKNGERKDIKVNLGGVFRIECRLFVDDKKIEVIRTKKSPFGF